MNFTQLTSAAEVLRLIKHHNARSTYVVLDTETTGLDTFNDTITSFILTGYDEDSACSISPKHLTLLSRIKGPRLVLHNFKFDYLMLYRAGVDLRSHPFHDTMLLHHLVDETAPHSLDSIVQEFYKDDYKEKFWAKYKNFTDAPKEEALVYECKDVVYTGRVYRELLRRLADSHIPDALIEGTHRLAKSLFETELRGIAVDVDYLTKVGVELKPSIERWKVEMRESVANECMSVETDMWVKRMEKLKTQAGRARVPYEKLNFNSSNQLCMLLYDKLRLPVQTNKTGGRTADEEALTRLIGQHPIIDKLLDYRGFEKVYTAFIEGTLERLINGRVYPTFNVNGTVTGRISSSDPNLQQLPSKGEWKKVRGIYIPEPGHNFVTCDYGQLEVCIAAHFSLDPMLLKIINEGVSKHDITAEGVGIPRDKAKTLNFAMQYQCSVYKVMQILGCTKEEAQYVWDKYWETYAGEKKVIDECKAKVDKGIPIVNAFGRQRHFPTKFESPRYRDAAYRQAYSSLIQGTGADCTHTAFYTVAETMERNAWGQALFEVHDEIINMPLSKYCAESSDMLQSVMKQVGVDVGLRVPLTVDCSGPLERWEK